MAAPAPGAKIEISISCHNLIELDLTSASDPLVVIQTRNPTTGKWIEYDRTEFIKNKRNPRFAKHVQFVWNPNEKVALRFVVLDIDKKSADERNIKKFDKIGKVKCDLAAIVQAGNSGFFAPIINTKHSSRKNGDISLRFVELNPALDGWNVRCLWECIGLDKKDLFGKSDPYLVFERSDYAGSFTTVHKTEIIKNTLNPEFVAFDIPVSRLAPSSPDQPIKVICFDWDARGAHDTIGQAILTINELRNGRKEWTLINEDKKAKKGDKYLGSGRLVLKFYQEVRL